MKAKHLSLAIAALLAAGGVWFARTAWRTHASSHKAGVEVGLKTTDGRPMSGQMRPLATHREPARNSPAKTGTRTGPALRPPDPSRIFTDFTPEQRVEFARKGRGPGG